MGTGYIRISCYMAGGSYKGKESTCYVYVTVILKNEVYRNNCPGNVCELPYSLYESQCVIHRLHKYTARNVRYNVYLQGWPLCDILYTWINHCCTLKG